jgi:tetratricopeptide (TPR) repeat protein
VLLESRKDLEGSERILQAAYEKLNAVPGENDRRLFSILLRRADVLSRIGRLREADDCLSDAMDLARGMKGSGSRLAALASWEKEKLLRASGGYEKELRESIRRNETVLGRNHPYVARGLYHLGLLLEEEGRKEEAEPCYLRSMKIHEELLGPMHPVIATFLAHLAALNREEGKYEKAKGYLSRMIGIYEETLWQTDPVRLQALKGMIRRSGVDVTPVLPDLMRFEEERLGSDHPDLVPSLRYYAMLLESNHQLPQAEALLRRALRIQEKTAPSDGPALLFTRKRLAQCLFSQGKAADAVALTEETLALERKSYADRPADLLPTVYSLATYLQGAGRYPEAEESYRRVLDFARSRTGTEGTFQDEITRRLIQVCLAQGRSEEAGSLRKQLQAEGRGPNEERTRFPSCPRKTTPETR